MKPVENEEGKALEPGADKSMDGKDRRDHVPGEDVSPLRCLVGLSYLCLKYRCLLCVRERLNEDEYYT